MHPNSIYFGLEVVLTYAIWVHGHLGIVVIASRNLAVVDVPRGTT